ncbi:hypothetical protein J6590_095230 [Homalodisca vitripennis]|nr:hypothetical protein J6590_095230 [Homalodisca vitripennis]
MVEARKKETHLYTSHGIHLNPKGRAWLVEKICWRSFFQLEHTPSSIKTPVDSTINLGIAQSTQETPSPSLVMQPSVAKFQDESLLYIPAYQLASQGRHQLMIQRGDKLLLPHPTPSLTIAKSSP